MDFHAQICFKGKVIFMVDNSIVNKISLQTFCLYIEVKL